MLTSSKILLCLVLSFIGGIFIGSFINLPAIIEQVLIISTITALLALPSGQTFYSRLLLIVFSACLLIFALGLIRTQTLTAPESNVLKPNFKTLEKLKTKLQEVIDQNLSPSQTGILSALLLGNNDKMGKDIKEKLNISGIRHITAISGMHIVIISAALIQLGLILGLWRQQAFYFAVGFLWLFILMIGFQPSAVRAAVMGSIFLLAEKLGRAKTADRALFLTAAIMLAINPSLLRYSIGFQLSFAATLGIIYLMPFLQKLLGNVLNVLKSDFKTLSSLLAMTLAAQIFVLPLLIYHFGQLSIISPITNLLVVPVLPYLMAAGFLFVALGAISAPLALIFLFPAWLMLSYIIKISAFLADLPLSAVNFHLHWLWLFIIYSLLAITIWRLKKWQRRNALP